MAFLSFRVSIQDESETTIKFPIRRFSRSYPGGNVLPTTIASGPIFIAVAPFFE
jgi:hypothetical protein